MLCMCLVYYKHSNSSSVIDYFWPGLIFKLIMTVAVGFYYSSGDTKEFFRYSLNMNGIYEMDSFSSYWKMIFYSEFKSEYWKLGTVYWGNPRALFFMKMVSVLNMLTFKNYWLTSMYMSLFSYFGTFYLLKNIATYYSKFKYTAVAFLLFLPSVIFNSSGIIKESIAFGSICFVFGYAIQVNLAIRKINVWSTIGLLAGVFFLYKLKYYYLAALLPVIILYFVLNFVKQITSRRKWIVYSSGLVLILIFVYSATQIHENLGYDRIVGEMSASQRIGLHSSTEGMAISYDESVGTSDYFIKNSPKALIYGLFGPFVWEMKNVVMAYVSIENLLLVCFVPVFVWYWLRKRIKLTALEVSWGVYIVGLALFLALSTPNFGTLTRYKVSYFPFLCLIIFGNLNFVEQFFDDLLHFSLQVRRLQPRKKR